jgi:5-oxoprolinase (ATP-hydrolysing)
MRIGCDIGGTFTDLVMASGGELLTHKVLTDSEAPARGALAGLDELVRLASSKWSEVEDLIHGTTLVTNALIARQGVPTALLTTRGFRDVLGFGRQQRYDAYNLRLKFPQPLVARNWRFEVDERTLATGEVLQEVDPDEVRRITEKMLLDGVQSVAICFLHSYKNPANERVAAGIIRKFFPDMSVVASSQVSPVIREYERTVTTAACAYTQPIASGYLDEFSQGLEKRGFQGRFLLMQSSGGTATAKSVSEMPIRLLESGPAGGVRAVSKIAEERNESRVLAFDMGGTTAKACIIQDGSFSLSDGLEVARVDKFNRGSGMPVYVPTVDLIEIGAGGGSIASIDRLGLLQVGPESAGSNPGPACYGFGGKYPTVTDANLLLGYISAESFLGGNMRLDAQAAERVVAELSDALCIEVAAMADGIIRLVNENMAAAARMHMIERDGDPRDYVLVASGGAGPLHAAAIGRLLGVSRVVIPVDAGVMSAGGFLNAPNTYETATSLPTLLDDVSWNAIAAIYRSMEHDANVALESAGVSPSLVHFQRSVDMKLLGQVHEINVPIEVLDDSLAEKFMRAYQQKFKLVPPNVPVEALTWRLSSAGPSISTVGRSRLRGKDSAGTASRLAWFGDAYIPCAIYKRGQLVRGTIIDGPALVEDANTTTVIGPQDTLTIDGGGNLVIDLEGRG